MKRRISENNPESSSKKQGKDGSSRKRNLGKEEQAKVVRKKKMQKRSESPKETTSFVTKVMKVSPGQRAKWQPLSESTRLHLESKMNWLIVSLLYEDVNKEIKGHLNLLKERLLKRFETLKVPVEKKSCMQNAHKLLAKEKKLYESLEEGLTELQEEIDKAVQAATLRDDNIQSLKTKVEELKHELVAEEKKASKLFQRDGSLALPELSKSSIEAPLFQKRFLKIQNQERILNYLNSIQSCNENEKDENEVELDMDIASETET